jgi:predicted RNA binding protein YcfA (HicA-like mRNA interferase family)
MNGYYSLVIEKLIENGYTFLRNGKGSHEMWTNGKRNQTVSKNMPSRNMANAIMKQCGFDKAF